MYENLPEENEFVGEDIFDDWRLEGQIGHGKIGVVYKGVRTLEDDSEFIAACKLIPEENLIDGWEAEIRKSAVLDENDHVVSLKDFGEEEIHSDKFICIVSEFVDGPNLKEYIDAHEHDITLETIESFVMQVLHVFQSMENHQISHGDLHPGNILLSQESMPLDEHPSVKITDFGVGGSVNNLEPKNDYIQLADIIRNLLEATDKKQLGSADRYFYNYLSDEFVPKYVLESDPTKGKYVGSPGELAKLLEKGRKKSRLNLEDERNITLENPFDYLSCEQMGESYELIETLYSDNFPGYSRVQSRGNTIITGPRGCGKTTILRNMALKTKIESGSLEDPDSLDYFGVYYPSQDLHFAFRFTSEDLTAKEQELLLHYLSLSLINEFIETLILIRDRYEVSIPDGAIREFKDNLKQWITNYQEPPLEADLLEHLVSVLNQEKNRVGTALRQRPKGLSEPANTIPVDFLAPQTRQLINQTEWGTNLPILFLIDDYSTPKISEEMQATMNDIIMERWSQVYFKITTESIASFHALNTSGKTLEESREFEVVDLANHFIGEPEKRTEFLTEVINTRLENTQGLPDDYTDIQEILGKNPYNSYNELAREIRSDSSVKYAGYSTMCDLFSGDISEMLRIVRGMFEEVGPDSDWKNGNLEIPISFDTQDEIIREYGASFLNKIESVPNNGPRLKKIAQAFGDQCNFLLKTENSSNQTGDPPRQTFRIEMNEPFTFRSGETFAEVSAKYRKSTGNRKAQEELVHEAESVYNSLLRYGVFLLDVRGKSIRGKVVPRLYLRRLLLPKFNLTPNQRDNIRMDPSDFLHLLVDPDGYPLPEADRPRDESLYKWDTNPEDDGSGGGD